MSEPQLIAREVVRNQDTDFALLSVGQFEERPASWTLATSTQGRIGLTCGSRYANLLSVEMERWTGKPSVDLSVWEEWDEVPLSVIDEDGPFVVAGFEQFEDESLDVEGLGRARARVCVRGRGVTPGGDLNRTNEEWLIQVWPDPDNLDAMAGGPRVLIRELPQVEEVVADLKAGRFESRKKTAFYGPIHDLVHLVRWAPGEILESTLREIGERLAYPHAHLIGGLYECIDDWYLASETDPLTLEPNDPFEVRLGKGPHRKYLERRSAGS